jgi:hypothetical protein
LNLGIKPIKDKESWLNAKKIIESHLRCPPYWSGPSGDLITTGANIAASVWWEEVIAFFCEPPVSDLFVGETRFDGKGFKRIDYIDCHFYPPGVINSLGYIIDLIDIRQKTEEPVVSLKARFLQAFSSLKLGGIGIDSALQVGFMLRALLGCYHPVVQEFRLGCHPLSEASLQTVVDQCVNFDNDPFLGHVGKDGKVVRNTSANAAGATPGDGKNAYEALAAKLFNYRFGRWKKAIRENYGKCMFCHDTACNSDHKSRNCPILKKLGFKLEKRTGSDNAGGDATSCVAAPPAGDASKPTSSPAPALDATTGSETIPGAYAAAAEPDSYDLGDNYDYEGRSSGLTYLGTRSGKPNATSIAYINTSLSCHHTSNNAPTMEDGYNPPYMRGTDNFATHMGGNHFAARSSCDPRGVKTIYLPKTVLALLQNPRAYKPDC